MSNYIKLIVLGLIALFAMIAINNARDLAYQVHAIIVMLVAIGLFIWTLRRTDEPGPRVDTSMQYNDGVVRAGVIATALWGVVGFLVGVTVAFQLAFPSLNFEWAQGYANFGRLRPLHTSAVIFAFGGNALIATSFYVVQRTSASRLSGHGSRCEPTSLTTRAANGWKRAKRRTNSTPGIVSNLRTPWSR